MWLYTWWPLQMLPKLSVGNCTRLRGRGKWVVGTGQQRVLRCMLHSQSLRCLCVSVSKGNWELWWSSKHEMFHETIYLLQWNHTRPWSLLQSKGSAHLNRGLRTTWQFVSSYSEASPEQSWSKADHVRWHLKFWGKISLFHFREGTGS